MSARQWKPGDVAVSVEHGYRSMFVEDCEKHQAVSRSHWHNESGGFDEDYDKRRPLVVIDPEDREQADRLIRAFWANGHDDGDDTAAMQAALHSLIADRKPACPASIAIGGVVLNCERATADHRRDHRNDSIGQGVRWSE